QICNLQVTHNYKLNKYPQLTSLHAKDKLSGEGVIFGTLYEYYQLKQLLINTLCHSFSLSSAIKGYQNLTFNSQ
ncbi:hypothetical protein FQN50_009735, partial [Emmonsiellopsis sp. PD_5]